MQDRLTVGAGAAKIKAPMRGQESRSSIQTGSDGLDLTRSSAMPFRMTTERHYTEFSDGSGIWQDTPTMVNENGIKLMMTGSDREGSVHFQYTGRNVSLAFRADRDDDEHRPTDTWDVLLGFALQYNLPADQRSRVGLGEARKIAQDIEEALRAWPRYPSEPPVAKVVFWMPPWAVWQGQKGDVL
jgi:hypothetical protein